ncbi:acyl-CoA-binding protein homolog [Stomoxys calcitrans]|uniref:ACB domain-containing protein n=1 Tax=Stomoxys calcitrans TaxID=35570 RepID=A0A1I8QA63_STOCA|nr:acyl-CoA-binding protein homolog [Stomoxys calcitrans]
MDTEEQFNAMVDKVKEMLVPNDEEMMELYALHKQATVGDNTTDEPSAWKAKAQWECWNKQMGKSKETAQLEYIAFATILVGKYAVWNPVQTLRSIFR